MFIFMFMFMFMQVIIIVEGIYSMEGECTLLKELVELKKKYK